MNHKLDKETPRFDVQLSFDEIGVLLDDNQYRDVISLVDMYHFYIRQHQVSWAYIYGVKSRTYSFSHSTKNTDHLLRRWTGIVQEHCYFLLLRLFWMRSGSASGNGRGHTSQSGAMIASGTSSSSKGSSWTGGQGGEARACCCPCAGPDEITSSIRTCITSKGGARARVYV